MKVKLLAVVAACAVCTLSYGQSSNSDSGASASSTNSSTNNNTSNNNPQANANSGSSSGSVSNATGNGGQGGQAIGNNGNNQSNNRANSSSNSSTASNSTANNAGNNQSNGSSSRSSATGGAGGAGGQGGVGIGVGGSGGQGGVGVGGSAGIKANISPSNSITFTGPPVSTVNTRTTGETTQNLNQTYHGTTENIQSGRTETYVDYGGTQTIKNVPSMNAPPLTSSNDTCMGSVSGGLAVAGLGLSGGSTYTDEHCKRIKMSRELWNKGMKAASLAMDCMDPAAREALEITGFTCPQTTRASQQRQAMGAAPAVAGSSRGSVAPAFVDPSRANPGAIQPGGTTQSSYQAENARVANASSNEVRVPLMTLEQQREAEERGLLRQSDLELTSR